ncbi:MAG: HAMP domain-containing sensor histidine kinase [Dehalococcoidia bacterium]
MSQLRLSVVWDTGSWRKKGPKRNDIYIYADISRLYKQKEKRMSLRTRLVLSYIFIIVVCLGIVAAALLAWSQQIRERQALAQLTAITRPIYVQFRGLSAERSTLSQAWAKLREQSSESRLVVFLLDGEGNVLRQIVPSGMRSEFSSNFSGSPLPDGSNAQTSGTFYTEERQKYVFNAYSIEGMFPSGTDRESPGVLMLAVPCAKTFTLWVSFARPLLWAGLIALVISIIIAIILARSVYLPVRRVTEAAGEIANGKYEQEVVPEGPAEIEKLAMRFNQMAAQVRRSQTLLRNFVADVSHELRSPLTSIQGFATAILDGTAKDKEAHMKAAGIIDDESKRMMRLVNDLLELSRIESGQVKMLRETIDLKELLDQCREMFALRAEEKNIELTVNAQTLDNITGDIDRLEQVFCNLLDNALKHTPSGGKVSVSIYHASPRYIEVDIADTGPGISGEQLPYVFERFYRADSGQAKTGTGLGLAISREIARAHGGDITVNSTAGKGTTFKVILPSSLPADKAL